MTAGGATVSRLASSVIRETIWVSNEHLNLYGSVSGTSESDGHPDLYPDYTFSHVLMLDAVSTFSI